VSVADDARYGISEFVSDPALLGPWFSDPSWHNWVVVLKAAFAERMSLQFPVELNRCDINN
jgi:hypothetical protein